MKTIGKYFCVIAMAIFATTGLAGDKDDKKASPLSAAEQAASTVAGTLLKQGLEGDDAILLMAAAKMMGQSGSAAFLKAGVDGAGDLSDKDLWSVSEVYMAAAEAAGEGTELAKQAMEMAKSTTVAANEEGCWGYTHYHTYWWYDAWGYYHERTIWHYC